LETSASKILQLEDENKRLLKQLASLRDEENGSNTNKATKTKLRHITNGISNDTNGVDVDDLETQTIKLTPDVHKQRTKFTVGDSCSALEMRASLLYQENTKLVRKMESFQQTVDKVEFLERENSRLAAELEQAATKAKEWSEAVAEVELEKERLERYVKELETAIDGARMDRLGVSRLEEELSTVRTQKDKLQQRLTEVTEPAGDVSVRNDEAPEEVTCECVNHKTVNTRSDADG